MLYQTHTGALHCLLPSLTLLEKLVLSYNFLYSDAGCQEQLFTAPGNLNIPRYFIYKTYLYPKLVHNLELARCHLIYVVERAELERVTLEDDKQLLRAFGNLKCLEELELVRT